MSDGVVELVKAVRRSKTPPCDKGCPMRQNCKVTQRACPAFWAYMLGEEITSGHKEFGVALSKMSEKEKYTATLQTMQLVWETE